IVPIAACVYAEIVSPLLTYASPATSIMTPRLENKIFWPALAAISVVLVIRNWSRLTLPPHIICLFAYLALAGASVLWAFKPEFSVIRFILQLTIVTSIVLPALAAARTAEMMRGLFLCFGFALILNVFFVLNQTPIYAQVWGNGGIENVNMGYPGYFTFKGLLGECAAIAFLLSLHEILYPGGRRALGIIVIAVATYLMVLSESKGSLGLALIAPSLAGLTLIIGKAIRISPAIVLLPIPICYAVLSRLIGDIINRFSWHIYGNYTLSGRTDIWDFVQYEIARRPLLGWGYQSFWLVGPDAPSIVEAPGWIKTMPSAHNGYLDTTLDTGHVGLCLLIAFIFTTLHAIGRVAERDLARAWLLLSLALFVILVNFIESTWMHGQDMLWLIFAVVAAETGRHWRPVHPGGLVSEPILRGPVIAGRRPRLARAGGANRPTRYQNRRT
ncbi:MAG: O-antigen ligase family protein, partial [Anaerolineales bacterium]